MTLRDRVQIVRSPFHVESSDVRSVDVQPRRQLKPAAASSLRLRKLVTASCRRPTLITPRTSLASPLIHILTALNGVLIS